MKRAICLYIIVILKFSKVFSVEGFSETMFDLLSKYLQKDREEQAESFADNMGPGAGTSEDVLVKVGPIRKVADQTAELDSALKFKVCITVV